MKELGRKVRAQRTKMGLTQTELGRRVGRTHGWVSNLEQGSIASPPAEVLTALARELGHDPAEYLRLAGRVALTAEQMVPGMPEQPPAWAADVIQRLDGLAIAVTELKAPTSALTALREAPATYEPAAAPSPWGLLVRLGRTARGMTPGALAREVGVNARTVQAWEAGRSDPPLRQQALLLGVFSSPAEAPAARRRRTA